MSDTKEIWKKRVASWRASGKTAEKYSAGRGWSAGTLLWWSSRLGREAAPPAVRIAQLVRSPAPRSSGQSVGTIVIELLDARVRITVETGVDRSTVMAVLESLTSQVTR